MTAASAALERALPPQAHRLLVCVTSDAAWPTSAGVVANLRKDGYDARVNAPWLHIFGQQLAASGQETEAIFLVSPGQKPPALTVAPVRRTSGGDLVIDVYSPGSGFVPASVCPPVT